MSPFEKLLIIARHGCDVAMLFSWKVYGCTTILPMTLSASLGPITRMSSSLQLTGSENLRSRIKPARTCSDGQDGPRTEEPPADVRVAWQPDMDFCIYAAASITMNSITPINYHIYYVPNTCEPM